MSGPLYSQDHDFSRFDKGSRHLPFLQTHFANRVRCNHRGNPLSANRQGDLCHDSFDLNVEDAPDQLIPCADLPELSPTLRNRQSFFRKVKMLIQLAFGNPVMSALGLDGVQLSRMDPSLQRGIADAEHLGRVPGANQLGIIVQE
jgi:hypothetical protein